MKILVIGGMHGNEPLGTEAVRLLIQQPLKDVTAVLANERAVTMNCRFLKKDLNRSFPGAIDSGDYEARRAAEILAFTKAHDLVLDFHNTHCPDNDCGFVGETASSDVFDVAAWLGLRRIVVADYDCLNKYATNCLSIEISLDSQEMDAAAWYRRIAKLARMQSLPAAKGAETYHFVYRITLQDKERLCLAEENLKAFQAISPRLAKQMGVKNPAYPVFIGDAYTSYNYGGLLNKLN